MAADRGLLFSAPRVSIDSFGLDRPDFTGFFQPALPPLPLLYKRPMRQKNFRKGPRPAPPRGSAGHAPKPAHKTAEKREKPSRGGDGRGTGQWLYGLHAVQAALANPRRKLGRAALTPRAAEQIGERLLARVQAEIMEPGAIDRLLPPGAVHQGAALETWPLKAGDLDSVLDASPSDRRRIVLVLDQLSDPHNVGAILRTAAAFGVTAVVVQDRHAPPQSGALAKAASGALDLVPYVEVVNGAGPAGRARLLANCTGAVPRGIAIKQRGRRWWRDPGAGGSRRRCRTGAGLGRFRHPAAGARALRGRRLHSDRRGNGKPECFQRRRHRALRAAALNRTGTPP